MGHQFEQRQDGMPALNNYRLPLSAPTRSMDLGLLYKALEQGQVTIGIRDGFIGDGGAARFHQAVRLLRIRRQMQIGEENLALAQLDPFAGLRLLDLHDHVGAGKDLGSAVGDDGARLAIGLVGGADACTRVGLDDDTVAGGDILTNGARGEADAIFVNFDFLWHSDAHRSTLPF